MPPPLSGTNGLVRILSREIGDPSRPNSLLDESEPNLLNVLRTLSCRKATMGLGAILTVDEE